MQTSNSLQPVFFWASPPAVSAATGAKVKVSVQAAPLSPFLQVETSQSLQHDCAELRDLPGGVIGRRLVEECLFLNPQYERLPSGQLIGAQCCGCGAVVRNWPVFVSSDIHVRKRRRTPYASRLRFAFGTPAPIGSPAEFAVALYSHALQRWSAPCSLCGRDRRDHRGRASTRHGSREKQTAKLAFGSSADFDPAVAMQFSGLVADPMLPPLDAAVEQAHTSSHLSDNFEAVDRLLPFNDG
jgi:hypothetical protein